MRATCVAATILTFGLAAGVLGCKRREAEPKTTAAPPAAGALAEDARPTPDNRLMRLADCPDAALRRCLERFVKPAWRPEDVRRYLTEEKCFARMKDDRHGRELQRQAAACLPLEVGVDVATGKTLSLQYYCSDVCPDYGGVSLLYAGVPASDCGRIGGRILSDHGWGGYIGCAPGDARDGGARDK